MQNYAVSDRSPNDFSMTFADEPDKVDPYVYLLGTNPMQRVDIDIRDQGEPAVREWKLVGVDGREDINEVQIVGTRRQKSILTRHNEVRFYVHDMKVIRPSL